MFGDEDVLGLDVSVDALQRENKKKRFFKERNKVRQTSLPGLDATLFNRAR